MMEINIGDKVVLNSLLDFSQDQGEVDWTTPEMLGRVLTVGFLHNRQNHTDIKVLEHQYSHATNRFAVVHNGEQQ